MTDDNVKTYDVAVLPGDGIGVEVVPPALEVLEALGRRRGFAFRWTEHDWSCNRYLKTGSMMPKDGVEQVRNKDAILLGAVGAPEVPDHISLWGMLIPLRRDLKQYACLRPVRLMKGVASPLANRAPGEIDFLVIRENNEGEYSQVGGRLYQGTDDELVVQNAIFTRRGVDRIITFAFEQARRRKRKHLTSATKSNGIFYSMPFWDDRFAALSERYPDVRTDKFHIDILTAHLVQHPDRFDVIVASNLFGDILTDLGPAIAGSLGLAPSANLNPEKEYPSMFEPVHGSAPDIAGQGIANPIAQIWAGAMMLDHLGHADAAEEVVAAIEAVLASHGAPKTPDLGGRAKTKDMTEAILAALPHQGRGASSSHQANLNRN
jgi:tartrate dehydrogenase/decarboxylase / D-malate dehydrogenase